VDCGNPAVLDFGTGDFAVSAWIKLTTIERATVYAKGGDNGGGIRYTLAMGEANDNKMTLTTDDDSSKRQTKGDTVVNDGAWHHVVGMRSGNTGLVYVDGVLDGTQDLPEGYDLSGSSQHNALIGAITSHTDGSLEKFFTGTIDDVRVYDRALSNGEIADLAGL
jgi:sialidase-1